MHAELTLRFDTIDELTAALGKLAGTKALANIAVRQDTAAPAPTPAPSLAAPEKSSAPAPRRGRKPNPVVTDQAPPGAGVQLPDPAPEATVGNGASVRSEQTPSSEDAAPVVVDAPTSAGETQSTATATALSVEDIRKAATAVADYYQKQDKVNGMNKGLAICSDILNPYGKSRFNELDPAKDQDVMAKILADLQKAVQ